jgi:hypothetical protein
MEELLQKAVHEIVPGILLDEDDRKASTLLVGTSSSGNGSPRASGLLVLRFCIPLLYEAHLALNPAYLLGERGGELSGWKAWDFTYKRYELYPRSELTGLRTDGVKDVVFLKTLDVAAPVRVFAYPSVAATLPLSRVTRLVVKDDSIELPERLVQYLPPENAAN